MMDITLLCGSDKSLNTEALMALHDLPEPKVITPEDHKHLEGRGGMPAIDLPDGRRIGGIDNIKKFVAEQVANNNPG
jgi:hypothetical protein